MSTRFLQRHLHRTQRCQQGSVLVIALVMVFVVGLLVAAVMSYTGTSLRANSIIGKDSNSQYAAEGALEGAIQNILNAPGSQKLGYTDGPPCKFTLPAVGTSPQADVTCTPRNVSSQPGNGGNGSTSPGSAILTLGQRASEPGRTDSGFLASLGFGCFAQYPYNWLHDRNCNGSNVWKPIWFGGNADGSPPWGPIPEPGIMFQASAEKQGKNTGPVLVQGPIYDNSTIATYSQFNLIDQADVNGNSGIHVRQPCAPSGGSSIGTDTNGDGTIDAQCVVDSYTNTSSNYNDPGYPYRGQLGGQQQPPALAALPACGASSLVVFNPGWYNDATALDNLFQSPACQNKDFWFKPGLYYFDFRNLTSIPAFCDNSGNQQSSTPGASAANIDDVMKYGSLHEWCVRASSKGSAVHPHIVGGTPGSANADWLNPAAPTTTSYDPQCIGAACAGGVGGSFQPEANGRVSETIHGTTPVLTASVNVGGSISAQPVSSTKANGASSTQLNVPGTDDFPAAGGDYANASSTWLGGAPGSTVSGQLFNPSGTPSGATPSAWTNSTGANVINDSSVATSPTVNLLGTTSLTVGGMTGPAIPGNATITAVTVSVRHGGADASTGWNASTLQISASGCTSHTSTLNTPPASSFSTFTISNAADVSANLSCLNTAAKIAGATFKYTASKGISGASGKVNLDGVQLSVTYTLPATTDTALRKVINLGPTPQIAPDATTTSVSAATVTIKHREQGAAGAQQLAVSFPGSSPALAGCTINLTRFNQAALGTDANLNLVSACGVANAQQLNRARFTYQVSNTGGVGASVTAQFGGITLTATYTDTSTKSVKLGFAPGIAAGASVGGVSLDVAHDEPANMSPTVVVTNTADGATCTFTTANGLTASAAMHVDHLDASSCLNTVAEINGAQAQMQMHATGAVSAAADLDGMQLNVQKSGAVSRASFPGACDPNAAGVQFVFGGDSRMYMPDGDMELCAGPPAGSGAQSGYTAQQIAVYGIPPVPPVSPSTVTNNSGNYCAAGTGGSGQPTCDPNGALKIDDVTQDASGNVIGDYGASVNEPIGFGGGAKTITVGGFGPAVAIPSGMHVAKVLAQIDHWEQGATLSFGAPTIKFGSCSAVGMTVNGALNPATQFGPADDTLDITSCLSTLGAGNPAAALPALTATFSSCTANIFTACTEHLDGVRLIFELEPTNATTPVYAPENGCVAGITSYPNYWDGISDTDCALLKWDSIGPNATDQKAQVSIHGTLYAPGAAVDVDDQGARCTAGQLSTPNNNPCLSTADPSGTPQPCTASGTDSTYCYFGVDYPIFDRGIIVRHLRFKAFMKAQNAPPIISCGGPFCGATASPKQVDFTVVVNGTTRISATVCFGGVVAGVCQAGSGSGPPQIMSWTET